MSPTTENNVSPEVLTEVVQTLRGMADKIELDNSLDEYISEEDEYEESEDEEDEVSDFIDRVQPIMTELGEKFKALRQMVYLQDIANMSGVRSILGKTSEGKEFIRKWDKRLSEKDVLLSGIDTLLGKYQAICEEEYIPPAEEEAEEE